MECAGGRTARKTGGAHADDDAEMKEEKAVVADDASASSGEIVEEAGKR